MNDEGQTPPPQERTPSPEAGVGGSEGLGGAAEISRRVAAILDTVESEAQRLREDARAEAAAYLEHAKRRADELLAERQRLISAVSDELLQKSEAVASRLDDAAPVRQGFENLVRALGDAAERLSREAEAGGRDFEPPAFSDVPRAQPQPAPQPYAPAPPVDPAPPYPRYPEPPQPGPPSDALSYGDAPAQPSFPAQPHPARAPSTPGWQTPPASPPPSGGTQRPAGWRDLDDARMIAIQMAATGATRSAVGEHLQRALGVSDPTTILDEIFGAGTGDDARVPWTAGPR